MICEMCGAKGNLVRSEVEGVIMKVCEACSKYGKIISAPKLSTSNPKSLNNFKPGVPAPFRYSVPQETNEVIVDNVGEVIRRSREKKCMTQEEFSRFIAVKESFLHKVESGNAVPDIPTARKWEKVLGVKIVMISDDKGGIIDNTGRRSTGGLTIGDMIK